MGLLSKEDCLSIGRLVPDILASQKRHVTGSGWVGSGRVEPGQVGPLMLRFSHEASERFVSSFALIAMKRMMKNLHFCVSVPTLPTPYANSPQGWGDLAYLTFSAKDIITHNSKNISQ